MPNVNANDDHKSDSNCAPLSVVIDDGIPNREIQFAMRARPQVSACVLAMGITSGQRVKRSMHVNKCVHPLETGNGPTMHYGFKT